MSWVTLYHFSIRFWRQWFLKPLKSYPSWLPTGAGLSPNFIFKWFIPVVCNCIIIYQNDIRWVSQNTTLYYGVSCQKIDNMSEPLYPYKAVYTSTLLTSFLYLLYILYFYIYFTFILDYIFYLCILTTSLTQTRSRSTLTS